MADNWSDEELLAAVEVYVEMQRMDAAGIKFNKSAFYEKLTDRFGRKRSAFEMRMSNISHIYQLQGRTWVSGLKPLANIGPTNTPKLEKMIAQVEGQTIPSGADLDDKVAKAMKDVSGEPPKGQEKPGKSDGTVTQYQRDAKVIAWVLGGAKGICECCSKPAPFDRVDGTPYLEVHHVHRLADGGPDVIGNAVAICPNCHMELHYGGNKKALAQSLRKKISRLGESA